MQTEDKKFHIGLKAFIKKDSSLLVLQGSSKMDREGLWGLPGGKIQTTEDTKSLEEILMREVHEECGNSFQIEVGSPFVTWRFPGKDIFLVGYHCEYVKGDVELSEEHKDYKWLSLDDSIDHMEFAPGYREVIQSALNFHNNGKGG
jgi:8-oxo-dGTP diphosphatase